MTPTITPTPLPPTLTDGTNSWLLIGVSFTNTTKIEGYDRPLENGMVYLVVEFQNQGQGIPAYPSLKGTNKIDYSQVYVTDSLGNKYIAVNDEVKMVPIAGSNGFTLGDFAIFFQAMPEGTHGFHLYFSDFPVVDLGQ